MEKNNRPGESGGNCADEFATGIHEVLAFGWRGAVGFSLAVEGISGAAEQGWESGVEGVGCAYPVQLRGDGRGCGVLLDIFIAAKNIGDQVMDRTDVLVAGNADPHGLNVLCVEFR